MIEMPPEQEALLVLLNLTLQLAQLRERMVKRSDDALQGRHHIVLGLAYVLKNYANNSIEGVIRSSVNINSIDNTNDETCS